MKTAISVRDNLFQRIEKYAKTTKMSRSQLFSEAVEEYLNKREREALISKVNEVCEKVDTSLDPVLMQMQVLSLPKDEW
jgi:metal-responsive CopG/Arc/MetJ family transcriptional regulator